MTKRLLFIAICALAGYGFGSAVRALLDDGERLVSAAAQTDLDAGSWRQRCIETGADTATCWVERAAVRR